MDPARDMLDRIGDKRTLSVIHELAWGPRRFTELKRRVDGVSQRMLTATLRGLERDGLVSRLSTRWCRRGWTTS